RVRHHPGRARLRGGDRGAAYPPLVILRSLSFAGPLEAELALLVAESAGPVDPDGALGRVGHDDERARAERLGRVPARPPDQRPGQAPAAGRGVGLDVLL